VLLVSGQWDSKTLADFQSWFDAKKTLNESPTGFPALQTAARSGDLEKARQLLSAYPILAADDLNSTSGSPLQAALEKGHFDVAQLLLSNKASIEVKDCFDRTPLSDAAARGDFESVQWLLSKGANPNVADFEGQTPLHHAVVSERAELVAILLASGADRTLKNILGRTPLDIAKVKKLDKIEQLLQATDLR